MDEHDWVEMSSARSPMPLVFFMLGNLCSVLCKSRTERHNDKGDMLDEALIARRRCGWCSLDMGKVALMTIGHNKTYQRHRSRLSAKERREKHQVGDHPRWLC